MDDQAAPPIVPMQGEKMPISPADTNPQKEPAAAFPTFGTIVPPSIPPFASNAPGSSSVPSVQKKKNSPFHFEFPPISAPAQGQNPHPSGSLFHNSGPQNPPPQNKSFPNVSWRPKEPQVFNGKNNEDVHSWTEVVSHYFMFMQGTPQQEVAYAATFLRANAHDWFMAYLRKNQGRYPHDWAMMSAALVDRFGSRLRDRQALVELMVMRQNWHNVREFATDFENCVGKLTSSDENTLMQMFLWALDKELAKKVALAHPKSLQSAISIAEDLELAVRFAHRPVVKGGAAASSSGTGTQANTGGRQSTPCHGRPYWTLACPQSTCSGWDGRSSRRQSSIVGSSFALPPVGFLQTDTRVHHTVTQDSPSRGAVTGHSQSTVHTSRRRQQNTGVQELLQNNPSENNI